MDFEHPRHLVNVRDLIINESVPVPHGAKGQEQGGHMAVFNMETSLVPWDGISVHSWQPRDPE